MSAYKTFLYNCNHSFDTSIFLNFLDKCVYICTSFNDDFGAYALKKNSIYPLILQAIEIKMRIVLFYQYL